MDLRSTTNRLLAVAIILAIMLVSGVSIGQDEGGSGDETQAPGLLGRADTSSPRATLAGFREVADRLAAAYLREDIAEEESYLVARAVEMLDFSATSDSDSWRAQLVRVL